MRRQQNLKIDADAETQLVVQAARVNTRSKLTFADSVRFEMTLCFKASWIYFRLAASMRL